MKCAKKRGFATPFWLCCEIPFVGTPLTLSFKSTTRSAKFRDNTVRKRKEYMSKLFPAKFLENNCPPKARVVVSVFSDLKSPPPKTFPTPVRSLFPGDLARKFYAKRSLETAAPLAKKVGVSPPTPKAFRWSCASTGRQKAMHHNLHWCQDVTSFKCMVKHLNRKM